MVMGNNAINHSLLYNQNMSVSIIHYTVYNAVLYTSSGLCQYNVGGCVSMVVYQLFTNRSLISSNAWQRPLQNILEEVSAQDLLLCTLKFTKIQHMKRSVKHIRHQVGCSCTIYNGVHSHQVRCALYHINWHVPHTKQGISLYSLHGMRGREIGASSTIVLEHHYT